MSKNILTCSELTIHSMGFNPSEECGCEEFHVSLDIHGEPKLVCSFCGMRHLAILPEMVKTNE